MILHLQKTQQIIWQAANFWLKKKEKQSLSLTLCIDQYLLITFSEAIE
jgi:Holliday junction resolvase-like predicted endonuclease